MATNCELCHFLGVDNVFMTDDEATVHAQIHCQQQRLIDGTVMSVDEFIGKHLRKERKPLLLKSKASKSTNRSLYSFADEHVKQKFSSNPGQCDECDRKLQIFMKDGTVNKRRAVTHACIHLDKQLFACKHCDKRFTNLRSTKEHVRITHKFTGGGKEHYRDLSGPYLEEIKDMIARCFARVKPTTGAEHTRDIPMRKNRTLHRYCSKLLVKRNIKEQITCAKCAQIITFDNITTGIHSASKLINHACRHLGKPLFTCAQCEHKCACEKAIGAHLRTSHRLPHHRDHYTDATAKYQTDILEMIESCFCANPKNSPTSKIGRNLLKSTAMARYCLSLTADKDGKIACSKCGFKVKFQSDVQKASNVLINHACLHLKKFLFSCRHCDHRCFTKRSMTSHLRKVHSLNGISANCIDSTNTYQKELMDTLEECFGREYNGRNEEPQSLKRPVKAFRNSRYPIADACRCMLSHHHPPDSRAKCSLCRKLLLVYRKTATTTVTVATKLFIDHVLGHLGKPIFTCRRCQHSSRTEWQIRLHLKKHGLPGVKDYFIDRTVEYRDEIIALLQRCFGGDSKASSV